MINVRTVVGLLIGIAALVGAHLMLDVKTQEAPRALRRNALVPAAERAVSFLVRRPGEPETRLVRNAGNAWRIASPYVADADGSSVLRLSDALAFAPVDDEMTDAELLRIGRTREDFGLAKPRVVVMVGNGEKDAATIVSFGLPTPAGDGVYVTVGEADAVYVVSSNVFVAANHDAAGFRRRRVFDIAAEDVVSFEVKRGKGRFVRLVRDDASWKVVEPQEGVASSSRVRRFLDKLVLLDAQDFVWPTGATNETKVLSEAMLAGYGLLDDSVVAVTLKSEKGRDGIMSFGREAGKGRVYALVPDGAIVTVPDSMRAAAVMGAEAFSDARVFPLAEEAVSAISLDDDGTVYLLSRASDAVWRLDAPISATADAEAVSALVGRMLALKPTDITTNGVCVSVGTNVASVFVSRKALLADARLADLRSKEIFKMDPKLVKRVVATDIGKKLLSVVRDDEKGAWTVERGGEGASANAEMIEKALSALSPLNAVRIEKLKVSVPELGQFGLDKPVRTIAIDQTAADSVRRNILIGDVTDGGRFATIGASDAVFVISSDAAAALLAPIVK